MSTHSQSQRAATGVRRVYQIGVAVLAAAGLGAGIAWADPPDPPDGPDHGRPSPHIMWVNHFELLPGGSEVTTTYRSTTSGVGSGLTGLVIHSSTTGETFADTGDKVVHMALNLPKETKITGVRVCYELSNARSFISQIRLAQVEDPPSSAQILLDDGTDLVNPGPVCVDSAKTSIKAKDGSVLLSLRVNFGNVSDVIVVRALGLRVK